MTPVIMPHITIPENLVSMSPTPGLSAIVRPPTNNPKPAKNSPQATKNQTDMGKPNASASDISSGSFCKPCNIKMIPKDDNLNVDDFYDAIHFNKKGSEKYAKYLSNEITKHDICEK